MNKHIRYYLLLALLALVLGSGLLPVAAARPPPGNVAGPLTGYRGPITGDTAAGIVALPPFAPTGGAPAPRTDSKIERQAGSPINFAAAARAADQNPLSRPIANAGPFRPASAPQSLALLPLAGLLDSPLPYSSFQAQPDNRPYFPPVGRTPPYTHGAVGPAHLMSVHNGTFRIQDRACN